MYIIKNNLSRLYVVTKGQEAVKKKCPRLRNKKPEMCRSISKGNTSNYLLHNNFLLVSMVDKFSFTVFKEKILLKTWVNSVKRLLHVLPRN